jgi:hypothetical protein
VGDWGQGDWVVVLVQEVLVGGLDLGLECLWGWIGSLHRVEPMPRQE